MKLAELRVVPVMSVDPSVFPHPREYIVTAPTEYGLTFCSRLFRRFLRNFDLPRRIVKRGPLYLVAYDKPGKNRVRVDILVGDVRVHEASGSWEVYVGWNFGAFVRHHQLLRPNQTVYVQVEYYE